MKPSQLTLFAYTGFFAITAHLEAVTVPLTGGDAGQGITLDAVNFLSALNVSSVTPRTVQSRVFNGAPNPGFTIAGVGNFAAAFTFGTGETSANDLAMAEIVKSLAFAGGGFDVTLNSLTPGGYYQIDLIQAVGSFSSREQAILLAGVFQENVLLSQGNNAQVTTVSGFANANGQLVVGLRPSGEYGGAGPQDGAVLSGIAVTTSTAPDTDNDNLPDYWEYQYFPDDLTQLSGLGGADKDHDGAPDLLEFQKDTHPDNPDTDGDTLTDGAELNRMVEGIPAPTDPKLRDTDDDGLFDNEETNTNLYSGPTDTGTDPLVKDSDNDGFSDHDEVLLGSDPNLTADVPTSPAAGPLISLDASGLAPGSLATWTSTGVLARDFNAAATTPPQVTTLQGKQAVTFDGLVNSLRGPSAPTFIAGDNSRTVEAWVFNPAVAAVESVVAWGRRDGPDGTHSAFLHGTDPNFGAFGGWGNVADAGWDAIPPKSGRWTHLAYTYDAITDSFKIYADGVLAQQETKALNTWATDVSNKALPIRIGGQNSANGALGGAPASLSIAQLAIHDRSLTPAELGHDDTDLDGMPDFFEIFHQLNPADPSDADLDPDLDGVSSLVEFRIGTNPSWKNPDSDNDGLFDEWEIANFRDPFADPPESDAVILAKYSGSDPDTSDPDLDNYTNREEFLGGSDPNDFNSLPTDQDGDGMADDWERLHFGSIAAQPYDDFDNDGSYNFEEFLGSTFDLDDWAIDASNPKDEYSQPDTDGNGIGDGWESIHYFSIGNVDPTGNDDTDGLDNQAEYAALTNPFEDDTDGDGLSDSDEVNRMVAGNPAPTNPRKQDTDGDGLSDGAETHTGIYINRANTGSDPLLVNSDTDGFPDGEEVARGSDPNDSDSTPPPFALVAQWRMNETAGGIVPSTTDPTLPGVIGSVDDSPVTAVWQPGEGIGGALAFVAATDRVALPALDLGYGFTVMGWIRPTADPQPAFARMITSRFQDGFFLGKDGANNAWKFIVNGNFDLAGGTITAEQWQHVAASYDGTTARLYVDGAEVGSLPMAPPTMPIQPVFFGSETDPNRTFIGSIDEYKIFSGSLPAGDIATIYSQEQPLISAASPYDTWAQSFGINPAGPNGGPAEDFDADGTSNEVERTLGLIPNNGTSRFAITTSGTPATGLILTWPSQPGITFEVRSGPALTGFPTLEATVPAAASPSTTTSWSTGPFAPGDKRFFRVGFTH